MNRLCLFLTLGMTLLLASSAIAEPQPWRDLLAQRLPEYGHRNWIVVADSAYPKQSAPGIETIATGEDHLVVLEEVLRAVADAKHVRPVVMLDAELTAVEEEHAPGVQQYREKLKGILGETPSRTMPHEGIIAKLDEGARVFNVLVLKTNLDVPYTSVFIQLDCGYWSAEEEKVLRESMEDSGK